jgi:hypothetical protein
MRNGRWLTIAVAMLASLPLLAGLYVGAYLGLGEWNETALVYCRAYRTPAEAHLFQPAAAAESWLTGRRVESWVRDPTGGVYEP